MSDSIKKWEESRTDKFSMSDYLNGEAKALRKPINNRKEYPMYSGLLKYFPNALKYVSHVSFKGNEQHHAEKPLHWDKNKSTDEPDALIRHLTDHSVNPYDEDSLLHLGKVCWRALAMLERYLEEADE